MSAHLHMMSPSSKGLFQRAILMSGSTLSGWGMHHTLNGFLETTGLLV